MQGSDDQVGSRTPSWIRRVVRMADGTAKGLRPMTWRSQWIQRIVDMGLIQCLSWKNRR